VFRALHHRNFRRFFVGQLPSASETFLQQTALGWLVLERTHSAATLGIVLASGSLPILLLGPWGGAFADRFNLRRVLLTTQGAFAVIAGALWLTVATGAAAGRPVTSRSGNPVNSGPGILQAKTIATD
jgi:MFS family permease